MLASRAHAQSAVEHAVRSYQEGTAISNTIEMESLLYTAGSRQCNIASSFGVHNGVNHLYVCWYPSLKWTYGNTSLTSSDSPGSGKISSIVKRRCA